MALAEALSEPGRRFSPDQVMLKGHELNPGQYGTRSSSPSVGGSAKRVQVVCVPNGGVVIVQCNLALAQERRGGHRETL